MKYPKEYLDEIKLRVKVSQVAGKTVQLKKRGKEFFGLSPFKNEKSPSFTINDEKEFYHCFSSGEHGNIFDFLMKTKSIGFGEAVRSLAAEAGMQPYRFSNFDKEKDVRFQIYKNIYKEYSDHFHKELFNLNNKEALNYLNKRGLNKNIIDEFKLGYVPWKNNFYEELLKKYTEENINLTGLYYKHDKSGKYIDRFNSRIIFPVNNITGDQIAFGGRIIKESKLAKYINSPETEFYKKGSMIFNLDKAKNCRAETNEVIIVEGYMDVVSLYSSGIKNVIANSGTALTERQIDIIWKFFSNPIICLDGDHSGQSAALRIAEKLLPLINEESKIYFSIMPEGNDPDDFIKQKGKESFLSLLKEKQIIQTHIWNYYLNKIDRNNPFEISKFEKEIKKLCYSIKDETLKKYVLEDFLEKIKKLTPNQNNRQPYQRFKKFNKKQNYQILKETKTLHQKKSHFSKIQINEFSVLFIMLNYLEAASRKIEELSELVFLSEKNESLKKLIISLLSDGFDQKTIQSKISIDYKKLIEEIKENSSIQIITKAKNDEAILELLSELLVELKELNNLKKIESLEEKLLNNLDENSYSELIRLKSQLNRE
jgi:DNA primase